MGIPQSIAGAYQSLGQQQQKAFRKDFARRRRHIPNAWLAWVLFGCHYLYFGRVGMQFAFWLTLGGFGLWWLVDFIRIPGIVRQENEDLARELMVQHRSLA